MMSGVLHCFVVAFFVAAMVMPAAYGAVADSDGESDSVPAAQNCIAWTQFSAVSFTQGSMTQTRRRTANIPTLNCVGSCPSDARLEAAQCLQVGISDMGTPSWKCLPQFAASSRRYGLGTVRVECEGCTKRGDSSILRGSCALYYSVVETSTRRQRFHNSYHNHTEGDSLFSIVIFVFFIVFAAVMAKRICCPPPAYVNGQVVDGYPMQGGSHHYYGGGGGGFGTGMLTGLVVGDMLSRPHHGGGYYNDAYDGGDSGGWGGGWGGGDGGGYGGSDAA